MDTQCTSTSKQKDKGAHKLQPKPTTSPITSEAKRSPASIITTFGLPSSADLLMLQRTIGNRAVSRLIQTKLAVGPAGDRYEQEADQVAQQVMAMPAPAQSQATLQRAPEEDEEIQTKPIVQRAPEEEEELQAKPAVQRAASGAGFEVSGEFEQQLAANRGGGSPLPDEVRSFMESRFGADFSGVRIHTGSESAQLNRSVQAQAFTHGSDIYLGEGKTDVESAPGKQLLAHELTHVVQQTGTSFTRAAQTRASGRLQRTLAFKPGDLKGQLTFKAKTAGFFGKPSTWAQIQKNLQKYWANSKHPISLLFELDALTNQWLTKHGSSSNPNDLLKKQSLQKLMGDLQAEYATAVPAPKAPTVPPSGSAPIATPIAGPAPMAFPPAKPLPTPPSKPLPAALPKPIGFPQFNPLASPPSKPLPTPPSKPATPPPVVAPPVAAPTTMPPVIPPPISEAAYMQKIGQAGTGAGVYDWMSDNAKMLASQGWANGGPLTEAQHTAIRVYTAGDYKYINPVLIDSPGWLQRTKTAAAIYG